MTTNSRVVESNTPLRYDARTINTDGTRSSKAYRRNIVVCTRQADSSSDWSQSFCKWCDGDAEVLKSLAKAENRLADRLISQLGPNSSIGASIFGERRETIETISSMVRGTRTLLRAATFRPNAIGDLVNRSNHFRSLGFNQYTKADWGRFVAKRSGQYYLTYAWSLKPLFDDIYNTVLALQQPLDDQIYSIKASSRGPSVSRNFGADGYSPWGSWTATVGMGAGLKFRVNNPILYTAARVGLLNPAEWAWEAIPFSWLADQFIRVGSIISSWDDYAGIEIVDQYTTYKVDASEDALVWTGGSYKSAKYTYTAVKREPRRPVTRLELVYNPITSIQRALSDISFLTTFLNDPIRVKK